MDLPLCPALLIIVVLAFVAYVFFVLLSKINKVKEITAVLEQMKEDETWEVGKFKISKDNIRENYTVRGDSVRLPKRNIVQKLRFNGWIVDPSPSKSKRGEGVLADVYRTYHSSYTWFRLSFWQLALSFMRLPVTLTDHQKQGLQNLALTLVNVNQDLGLRWRDIEARKYREVDPDRNETDSGWSPEDSDFRLEDDGELPPIH